MLKTFDVAELRPGMHVQRLLGPWMQHPFWRTSFVLDEARLAQLQDSGVQQVVVDLARSQLDDEPLVDGVPPEAPGNAKDPRLKSLAFKLFEYFLLNDSFEL